MKKLIDLIEINDIANLPIRKLVMELKNKKDILRASPQTAQLFQNEYNCKGHTDHTDYNEHQDTSPPHGDYCD